MNEVKVRPAEGKLGVMVWVPLQRQPLLVFSWRVRACQSLWVRSHAKV